MFYIKKEKQFYQDNRDVDFLVELRTMVEKAQKELHEIRYEKFGQGDDTFDAWIEAEREKLEKIIKITLS